VARSLMSAGTVLFFLLIAELIGGYTTESVTHGQWKARPTIYLSSCNSSLPCGQYQIIETMIDIDIAIAIISNIV